VWWLVALGLLVALVVVVAVHDLVQRRHAILRNYPVVGHLRFILEAFGPELRQYIVTSNDEERPFSRDERRWIYTSAKGRDNTFGFGTDNTIDSTPDYLIVKHAAFPESALPGEPAGVTLDLSVPVAKVLGAAHGRAGAFRPASVVNISAMSFGSLSGAAIRALNEGAALTGCLHNTGEGGLSPFHRHGGELVLQIGTGYFGCRDADGRFSVGQLLDTIGDAPVRAIEIKLSQGAKPGLGGLLPAAKVTPEIAAMRGIPVGVDCRSPNRHSAFSDVASLVEFVEEVAGATGLPVGIKSAVGEERFWWELAARMRATGGGPDFVTVDGGEGGTGAAPLVFADHVALPFLRAFPRVYRAFATEGIADDVVFVGSGRLGLGARATAAFALGCDAVNVGREAMLAIGCIQAQRCHTGRCPTGVATQSARLARGLDPADKSVRVANYVATLRHELVRLARACGHRHPAAITPQQVELLRDGHRSATLGEIDDYGPGWGVPGPAVLGSFLAQWPGPVPLRVVEPAEEAGR
jgi:glutamate synthase domain-containing protein 2